MRIQEFVNKWRGKVIRDGQCVALFREYTEGFLGMPTLERLGADGGASGLFTRYNTDVGPVTRRIFEAIPYQQGSPARPEPGDTVVFGPSATNRWGHVGICTASDNGQGGITIFDQNGIAAMRGQAGGANESQWSMERVLGWLKIRQ